MASSLMESAELDQILKQKAAQAARPEHEEVRRPYRCFRVRPEKPNRVFLKPGSGKTGRPISFDKNAVLNLRSYAAGGAVQSGFVPGALALDVMTEEVRSYSIENLSCLTILFLASRDRVAGEQFQLPRSSSKRSQRKRALCPRLAGQA